jgi:hypothetical protein
MTNVLELDTVLNSKTYVGEKSYVNFGSPKQYIEPFLNKLSRFNSIQYSVKTSDRVANKDEDESLNVAYGRVLVEAKLPVEFTKQEHDSVIGMVYALDIAKPIIRIYSGQNAWACTNLAIFGARYVHQVDIMSGVGSIYEKSLEYIDGITAQLERFELLYNRMHETIFDNNGINRTLGYLLRAANSNKLIGTSPIISAMRDLDDPKSKYAIQDNKTTQWNIYSATTQYITDKVDILEKAQKTVMLSNLFAPDLNLN